MLKDIIMRGLTVEGNPLNHLKEDDFAIDEEQGFFMVVDGITRPLYDKNNPGRTSFRDYKDNKHFSYDVAHMMAEQTKEYIKNYDLKESLNKANGDVQEYYNRIIEPYYEVDFKDHVYEKKSFEKPGCCGVCGIIKNHILTYTNFGDCVLILIRDHQRVLLAPKQNAEAVKTYQSFKNRQEYVNYYVNKKVQNGYGIANGDEDFKELLDFKTLILKKNDILYACSDGIYHYLMETDINTIINNSLDDCIKGQRRRDNEKNLVYSDDMTIVKIEIK